MTVRHDAEISRTDVPRSLIHCFPWIWSRILFPGNSATPQTVRLVPFLILLILPAAVLYPCMTFHLFEPDEGRYAQIPREMLERGDWVVPHLQSKPYLDKPPMMYWLVMASYSLFGYHAWAARLIPALSVHGCILLVYLFGSRRLGERAGFLGALTLTVTHGFEGMARLLVLDGLLTLWTTLAFFCLWEAVAGSRFKPLWWLAGSLVCGLGVLTKGPIILVLILPVLWLMTHLSKSSVQFTWRRAVLTGIVAAGIAAPWYVAVCLRQPDFGGYFFWKHNLMRFFQPFDHREPVWYYLPIMPAVLLPGTLLTIPIVHFLLSSKEKNTERRSPELGALLLAGCWCVLFFSLSGSKLPTYILPAVPFLCLVVGGYIAVTRWRKSAFTWGAMAVSYVLMIVGNYWAMPLYAEYRSPMNSPERVQTACADPNVPVVCYPRHVDSVAFYVQRSDFQVFRSKYTPQLLQFLQKHDKTVVLFAHRHSCGALRNALPPNLKMIERAPLGLCDMAVIVKRAN